MTTSFPEFKKIEKIVNGKCEEIFFIDDIEVKESTYYTLLYDREETSDRINIKRESKSNQENKNHISRIEDKIKNNPQKMYDILIKELSNHYLLGYLNGQREYSQLAIQNFNHNKEQLNKKIIEVVKEYDKN